MKRKIIFTVIGFAFLASVSAQLKVDALGKVGIGTASLTAKLNIVSGNLEGLSVINNTVNLSSSGSIRGISSQVTGGANNTGQCSGIYSSVNYNNTTSTAEVRGLLVDILSYSQGITYGNKVIATTFPLPLLSYKSRCHSDRREESTTN